MVSGAPQLDQGLNGSRLRLSIEVVPMARIPEFTLYPSTNR
jgi:hypothetical protein